MEQRNVTQRSRGQARRWSATVDWICVGSGIGGCAAAIAGHDHGFTTVLLEKTPLTGGTTASPFPQRPWAPGGTRSGCRSSTMACPALFKATIRR